MNALFLSNDPALFDPGSPVRARMGAYAGAIGTLHVVSRAPRRIELQEGALFLHGVPSPKAFAPWVLARAARRLIRSESIAIVSAQDPFEYGWAAARAVRGTDAKLHLQVHTDFLSPWFSRGSVLRSPRIAMPLKNRIRRILANRLLPRADGIRAVSERVRNSLVATYGTRIVPPTVLPIAISSTLPEPVALPPHSFPFPLITVGRLEPEKRIEDIIEALSLIRDRYPAVGLIIVGEGREEKRLRALVRTRGVEDRVVFAGARADALGLMRSARAYIQASAYEGYGRTLIEAALARLPIITTDVGIVGEVFKGYEDVLATPPGDPTNLGYHIIALLEDVRARELMVRSAEARAQAHLAAFANLPELVARDLTATLTSSRAV
jgi:glycosyltransferase involved in cell wall biosynthesis